MSEETLIRLFKCCASGELVDLEQEYPLEKLNGIVPIPGDYILVLKNSFYRVKHRYFLPEHKFRAKYICLEVVEEPVDSEHIFFK